MIALKTLIGGSILALTTMTLPVASYAGDMGEGYHHGYGDEDSFHKGGYHHGDEDFHHKGGEKGHVMHGHLRVDVYIHKAGEEKHRKYKGEHMNDHWMHARLSDWDHGGYDHEHHGDWDHDKYHKSSERRGHWEGDSYGYESGGDHGDYGDDGGDY